MARQFGMKQKPERAGDVRQSQLITTFGIGSIVDFVRDTVMIGGVDSWDSLGGLISIGKDPKRLQAVLKNMLQKAMWCSADPLCANTTEQGVNSLNYAACHDCVLLPETEIGRAHV
jgi:hypothetical protein